MSRGSIEIPLRDTDEVKSVYIVYFFLLLYVVFSYILALHANQTAAYVLQLLALEKLAQIDPKA